VSKPGACAARTLFTMWLQMRRRRQCGSCAIADQLCVCVVADQFHRGASGETSVVERVLLTSDEDSMFIYKVCRLLDITAPHSKRCCMTNCRAATGWLGVASSVQVQCMRPHCLSACLLRGAAGFVSE
jgi:hypothetical protein